MIRQVSVDDRLLHGQVAFYWTSYYNLDMILVLNDEAANDEFTKMILGLAKPREVRLQIAEVEAGFEIVRRQLESPDNVLRSMSSSVKSSGIFIMTKRDAFQILLMKFQDASSFSSM